MPQGTDVCELGTGRSSGAYDRRGTPEVDTGDSVLEVEFCDDTDWVLANGVSSSCQWLGVTEVRFASQMGFSGVSQPGGVL